MQEERKDTQPFENGNIDGSTPEAPENIYEQDPENNTSENNKESDTEETKQLCVEYDANACTEEPGSDKEPEGSEQHAEDEEEYQAPKKLPLGLKTIALLSVGLAVFSVVMRICLEKEPWAGEIFYRYVSRYLQASMAALTSFIPFSLAETVLVMLPLVIIVILISAIRKFIHRDSYRLKRMAVCIFTAVCLIVSNYILNLSVLYCRPSLSELSGIDDSDITSDELGASAFYMIYRISEIISDGSIQFDQSGASVCPYGFDELDERINDAFDKYAKSNSWISPYDAKAKIIAFSDYMTYTHLAGIYTQYTGEANINVNYPDYVVCPTIAHEKAHQRGIAPEDEANLVAMFVLCESGDPYLEYCGYMSVFTNLMGDCYKADREFYLYNILPLIPEEVSGELAAYSGFFKKYETNKVSEAVNTANDTYLKLNGEKDGVVSYDMVSGMAARYILMQAEKAFAE